jgi:hypothetical protein
MNLEQDVSIAFADRIDEIEAARDLYRALSNTRWQQGAAEPEAMTWRSAGELVAEIRNRLFAGLEVDKSVCLNCRRPEAAHRIEDYELNFFDQAIRAQHLLCPDGSDSTFQSDHRGNEDYLDFYCSGGEGSIADWVAEIMSQVGYRPVPWSTEP